MINVSINGKSCQVESGSTILAAARAQGFDIPTLCDHKDLEPFTSCFICAVKVEGGKGNLVPACATKVRPGMVVTVESDELSLARKAALDLLLSDHLGDCLPPCQNACPADIPIRDFLAKAADGDDAEAARIIRLSAPFPGVLGRICPRPCEDACRRNVVDDPVAICQMKRHVADREVELNGGPVFPTPAEASGKSVAIVGAGPAGLTAAYFLRLAGHAVTVFEAKEKVGGMLRYGIPTYRLDDEVIDREMLGIQEIGVDIRTGVRIGTDVTFQKLRKDHDAVLLALGAQASTPMRVEGEDSPGVWSGIGLLEKVAAGESPQLGKKVLVIGGGNTAIDAARVSRRLGAEVEMIYRRTEKEMPASDFEIEEARAEGVGITFLAAPTRIEPQANGLVLHCIRMELGEPDASGRRRPVPIEGSEFSLDASAVIAAIGQKVDIDGFGKSGMELTRWGTPLVHAKSKRTSLDGVFACGDCETGADIAVRAVGSGRKAAASIIQFLGGARVTGEVERFNSSMGDWKNLDPSMYGDEPKIERIEMPMVAADERVKSFVEVETGFDPKKAMLEAERCLDCGCEAAADCKLREYADRYGAEQDRFAGTRREFSLDDSHPTIQIQTHKCINCGICVRICEEVEHRNVLGFADRGFTARIAVGFGGQLGDSACDDCGKCVEACPTAGIGGYEKPLNAPVVLVDH